MTTASSKLFFYLLFPLASFSISNPKTQHLIDHFDIHHVNGNGNDKRIYVENESHPSKSVPASADIHLASTRSSIFCKSSLINGRKRTFCNEGNLEQIPPDIPRETTILHLETNRLTRLAGRAFVQLPSLQSLYLNNNAISDVDLAAFRGLINLSELDLSFNRLKIVPSVTFLDIAHLQVLKLSGNRLETLTNHSFKHLPKLLKLELNNCGIREIQGSAFDGLLDLQYLQLANNKVATLEQKTFTEIRGSGLLRLLYLFGNPWHCDCDLRWLHDWVEEGLVTYDVGSSRDKVTTCQSPSPLARQRWTSLHSIQFACHPRLLSMPKERTLVVNQYESINFSCSVFLDPPSNPIWFKERRAISRGAIDYHIVVVSPGDNPLVKTSTLTIREAGAFNSGTYRCLAANSAGDVEMIVNVVVKVRDRVSTASKMERHGTTVVICVSVGILVVLCLILFFVHLSHKNDCSSNPSCRCGDGGDGGTVRQAGTTMLMENKRKVTNRFMEGLIYDGQFKYSRKMISTGNGSKSTFQLGDKKQQHQQHKAKSSSKNEESLHLHPMGVKTLPRHFRVRGSIDSGAFCFDYESCHTDSSHQSTTLNTTAATAVKGKETQFDNRYLIANDYNNLNHHAFASQTVPPSQTLFVQRSNPVSVHSTSSQSPPLTHILSSPSRGKKQSSQQQKPQFGNDSNHIIFAHIKNPVQLDSNDTNINNAQLDSVRYYANRGTTTAYCVDHETNAILPLKHAKDIFLGNYEDGSIPKFATMDVGKKQRLKERESFNTVNPRYHGVKQVRMQIDVESTEYLEGSIKKQSRNRSTQVPTPTEEDSFFPGQYLQEKEREKQSKWNAGEQWCVK